MSDRTSLRWESFLLVVLFCAALLAHFYFATSNWSSGFMPGHEFRQAQTALVAYYIDEQNNFSLRYELPLLGKPWVSVLLEVPIYQWSVVGLSRAIGVPHFMAARTVSLACFYFALPALYFLLGRLGLGRPRRLLALALILTCPVYIFYSRAFLMESMAVMCCAWFLLGFVRTMDERRWSWLALTIIAGTLAALIKSLTFAVWLVPAAGYGAWMLGRDWRRGQGWRPALRTVLWGAAGVAVALGALRWWILLTDPIKAAHHSAWIFTSKNLSQGGLLEIAGKVSRQTWGIWLERWQEAIMPPWLIGLSVLTGVALLRAVRWRVLGLSAVFMLAQFMFPFAYAYQDYYYYACTVFLLAALGLGLHGVLDSRLPRWCVWLIIALPFVAQLHTYWHGYRPAQIVKSSGGFPFTAAIRDLTPKKSVIIVAGSDWAAMIPFYAQRKALMIRSALENDDAYLTQVFDDLAGENVSALVLTGDARDNGALVERVAERFGMEAVPTFTHPVADVYCKTSERDFVQECLRHYGEVSIKLKDAEGKPTDPKQPFAISAAVARVNFGNVSPAPFRAYFEFGLSHLEADGDKVMFAHPNSDLWLQSPAQATQVVWDYGIFPNAYEQADAKTDGVEFLITGEIPSGERRQIYRRLLDPTNVPADRGRQHAVVPYRSRPGETLQFSTRPNKATTCDWAYWVKIEVK